MTNAIPAALLDCHPLARAKIVASLDPYAVRMLNRHFPEWAHGGQLAPPGSDWRTWVLMAGRGFGKTRAGAEWVMGLVRDDALPRGSLRRAGWLAPPPLTPPHEGEGRKGPHPSAASRLPPSPEMGEGLTKVRVALVAASLDEARRVMVEGPSGILAVARAGEVREWSFQRRRIVFASGAEATLFSGAHPEGLRGPEHDFAWCDELAKWRYPQETWDNLQLGLRRGAHPRALVTTTPRRGAALTALLGEDGVVRTGGASGANPHLPEGWVERQAARLTELLARQEIGGELLDEVRGALWSRGLIEACRVHRPHPNPSPEGEGLYRRVVIGVDPPAGSSGDACGIVAAGVGGDGIAYVLGDHSVGGLSPEGWARKVAAAAETHGATRVIAEANNGGRMVESVLRGAGLILPVRLVHAAEGKAARAAPVAALFESGRARLAGRFPALEDELAGLSWDGGYHGPGRSPDRADAMVWAMTELMLGPPKGEPSVRAL